MQITKKWLEKHEACMDAVEWVLDQTEKEEKALIKKALKINHFDWVNWYLPRRFTKKQNVMYAIFAAEKVLDIYEKQYPTDTRPREAIAAAKKCLQSPSRNAKSAAELAAWSARLAKSAAWSAKPAAWSAESTAWSAKSAAWAARSAVQKEIGKYGMSLLK